jgi:hypothetical protein
MVGTTVIFFAVINFAKLVHDGAQRILAGG